MFLEVAATYMILPDEDASRCRLALKLLDRYPRGAVVRVVQLPLPWIELVMMRRQLGRP